MTKSKIKTESVEKVLLRSYQNIPKTGEIIKGKVFAINKNGIFIDLKNFKAGIILPIETKSNPGRFKNIKVGDEIRVKVKQLENEFGYLEASLEEAKVEEKWKELKKMLQEKKIIKTKVLKANKGGLIVNIEEFQSFVPVSQLSSKHYPRVENGNTQRILQALQQLVNETLEVRIIDLDKKEKKIIASERAIQDKEIREAIKQHEKGDIVEGIVTGVVDFGAFIKFNDLEGLVHISELDYQLVENPHDIIKEGDKIKAKIINIDKNKISLSIKALKENPWEKIKDKYKTNQIVKGIITKFNPFGAFVQLDKHIHGLAHISEFGNEENMKKMLDINKKYDFKILSIKPKEYKMSLSPILKEKEESK